MKTILYATDYSKNSIAALKYAHAMSSKMNARLLVVHVFDYPTMLDDFSLKGEDAFPDIEGDAFKKHHSKLNSFCNENLNNDLKDLNIEIEAIEDKSVVKGIISKANEVDAFLIITGMKGGSALREIIMGNTTKHLLEKSSCPVLTIPSDATHKQIETIVYATDFEEEDFGAIDKLTEIAKPFNALIKIVHISPLKEMVEKWPIKGIKEKIHKYIEYTNLEFDIFYSDDVFNDLKIYLGNSNADLVAMLERESKSLTSKVFHRDLVKRMETYGKIPLLSFNAKNYGAFHL
ncbi:universal stress protein [Dokdonia ponticola]|uniref:Universal stress protein n=1 Tax=Dokdonia ponticola TaxID=2041041 RepID=A0ABV9HTT1_9FLAO